MRFHLIIFISLYLGVAGFAQEILTGLQFNPAVKARVIEHTRMDYLNAGLDTIPVSIPFFDGIE